MGVTGHPSCTKRRGDRGDPGNIAVQALDLEDVPAHTTLCYQVIFEGSSKRQVPVTIGAGGRYAKKDVAVRLHTVDAPHQQGTRVHNIDDPKIATAVVEFVGASESLKQNTFEWERQCVEWTIQSDASADTDALMEVTTALMQAGAYPGEHVTNGLTSSPQQLTILEGLELANLVESRYKVVPYGDWCVSSRAFEFDVIGPSASFQNPIASRYWGPGPL